MRIVAAQPGELGDHAVGPVLCTRLPTVADHIPDAALAHEVRTNRFLVTVQVTIHVVLHVVCVQFVHLKSRGLLGRWMIRNAQ